MTTNNSNLRGRWETGSRQQRVCHCLPPARARHRGFSFTEVMFAVIILGIGFIMVAAIFPVAIQQAKNTSEEVSAAAIAKGAASYIEQALHDGVPDQNTTNCPPLAVTSGTRMFGVVQQPRHNHPAAPRTPLWQAAAGNLILPEDPRYGFIFLYRRSGMGGNPATWDPYVQLYIIPVQSRVTTAFDPARDLKIPGGWSVTRPWAANLQARHVLVTIINDVPDFGGIDLIAFDLSGGGVTAPNVEAAVEGAYVIIANDNLGGANKGRLNGRVYRLGARRADLDTQSLGVPPFNNTSENKRVYELQPGSDFNVDPGNDEILGNPDDITALGTPSVADAFLIGRSYSEEALKGIREETNYEPTEYEGPAMPIGVYTTFVQVKRD